MIVTLIPARGGSKGVPRKNIKLLAGKPLIQYSIDVSLHSRAGMTIVSTDDKEIARVAEGLGAQTIMRPPELSTDTAPTEPVLIHALDELRKKGIEPEGLILLQPTCPLRSVDDLDKAIEIFERKKADTVVSVFPDVYLSWHGEIDPDGKFIPDYDFLLRNMRQKLKPKYHEIGSIYIMRPEHLRSTGNRMGGKMFAYVIDRRKALDIDDETDFWLAEKIIETKKVIL